jgi:hypothetical protein
MQKTQLSSGIDRPPIGIAVGVALEEESEYKLLVNELLATG